MTVQAEAMTMTMRDYLALKAVSSGMLHTLLTESPLHAWYDSPFNPQRPRRDSNEMDIGTYAHACLLEGSCDELVIVVADDWRTKIAKEKRDEARAAGKLPILEGKLSEVAAMVAEAKRYVAHSEIAGIFDSGAAEQTITWTDGKTPCKARPDWLTGDHRIVLHYKTTGGSANPDTFGGVIERMGYDITLVFYERGMRSLSDVLTTSVILAQETTAPYLCSLHGLSPALRDLAARKVERAMHEWQACATAGKWHAYPPRICWQEPKPWAITQEDDREYQAFSEEELKGGIPL